MIAVRRVRPEDAGAEAVLRPVGSRLEPVSPSSRRLEREAGEAVTTRLQELGELPVGGAVLTPAGELPVDFLIHVVVQSEDEPATPVTVERALVNGFRRAAELGIASVALAPLGTGPGSLQAEDAARVLFDVVRGRRDEPGAPVEVVVAVDGDWEEELYRRLAAAARPAGS